MPEDSKKNQHKHKNEPKEQRKPKQGKHQASGDRKNEKAQAATSKHEPKVPSKVTHEEPGPEFYQGLKRETDEILKITEEANAKYKKKEIESNWSKYEMPIESYEEIDDLENLGADFEKLATAPLSIGSHFQFKHEKSWDVTSEPSLYDKYFDIDMDNLAMAISTIPFFERNDLDQSLFTESDLISMDHRSIKYKQQYFKDKSFTTHDLEASERISKLIKEDTEIKSEKSTELHTNDIIFEENKNDTQNIKVAEEISMPDETREIPNEVLDTKSTVVLETNKKHENKETYDIDDLLLGNIASNVPVVEKNVDHKVNVTVNKITSKDAETEQPIKNPVTESPEELEKWLDDFLES